MRCLIGKDFIDDAELEEEGVAEMLMDENSLASAPRLVRVINLLVYFVLDGHR